MSLIIQLVPDNPKYLDSSEPVAQETNNLTDQLLSTYQTAFAEYERVAGGQFKSVTVDFDGEKEGVVFDFSLYETLLEIYVFEGWEGLRKVEGALREKLPETEEEQLSGGVSDKQLRWGPAVKFFRFTRNLIAVLIYETLIGIEQKAKDMIATSLQESQEQIEKVVDGFEPINESVDVMKGGVEGGTAQLSKMRFKDRDLAKTLFVSLKEIVEQREVLDETMAHIARSKGQLETLSMRRETVSRLYEGSNFFRTPYLNVTPESVAADITEATRAAILLQERMRTLHGSFPFGLLVIDALSVKSNPQDMEQKLWALLFDLKNLISEIRSEMDRSQARASYAFPQTPPTLNVPQLNKNWIPADGIESWVSKAAIEGLSGDMGWIPLVHEASWHQLVESEVIEKDSFEYVVYYHYVSALDNAFGVKRKSEESFRNLTKGIGRIAAALSLATLVTPVSAPFALVLRGASKIANLALLAHAITSVTDNMAQLNQLLALQLVNPDAFALAQLSRLGELAQVRQEMFDNIENQVLTEASFALLGQSFALAKRLLFARSYYSDLETLLSDGEENQ